MDIDPESCSTRDIYSMPDFVHPEAIEEVSETLWRITFPGDFSCYTHPVAGEAALMYNEIMINQEYLQHGLSIAGARCVLDVGANIGMFTLFVKRGVPEATVYAFEPMQDSFEILERNVRLHGFSGVHTYNVALGSQDHTERTLTYYPHMAANSTAIPAIKGPQRTWMEQHWGRRLTDFAFEGAESRVAQIRTLSSIIREQGIAAIDLIKIDVEGDEIAVLEGIEEQHWPMIRQVAVEVHSKAWLDQVREHLVCRGFEVHTELGIASPTGDIDLYARRP